MYSMAAPPVTAANSASRFHLVMDFWEMAGPSSSNVRILMRQIGCGSGVRVQEPLNEHERTIGCPRCGYDQRGMVESWTLQCPLTGECAECGLALLG